MKPASLDRSRSQDWKSRAEACIAHGSVTNSKRPQSFIEGVYPTHLQSGRECYVTDVDGNSYVDYVCGLGSNLFGYADRRISEAVAEQIKKGSVLSLATDLEVRYAERIKELFPCIHRLRILKTGSEACSAAVRIARAFTDRKNVVTDGYHGWHDEFTSLTPPHNGVNDTGYIWPLSQMQPHNKVAACIVEPIVTDYSIERITYLRELQDTCRKHGVMLIFDETITGLRFPGLSVAKEYGLEPDLIVLGKAIGGGFPLAIVGGRRDVMEADYFVSSTFAGDTLAMAASMEALRQATNDKRPSDMWNRALAFQQEFNSINPDVVRIVGYPMRGVLDGFEIGNALFMQEMCKAGVLFGKSFFWNYHHDKEAHHVLNLARSVITRIKNNDVKLEGAMPVKPFAQKVRENAPT